jgi:hypothetical protein
VTRSGTPHLRPTVSDAFLSQVHPSCGNCVKTQEECVYSTNNRSGSIYTESSPEDARHGAKRKKTDSFQRESSADNTSPSSNCSGGPDSAATPATNVSIESRLDRLTQLVEALNKSNGAEAVSKVLPEFGIRQEKRNRYAFTSDKEADELLFNAPPRSRQGKQNRSRDPSMELQLPPANSAESADPLESINMGYLSIQEGGRTRYVGSTFWAYVSDELDQLNVLLRDQNRYSNANGIGNPECLDDGERELSPLSDASEDSHQHSFSFHKAGDSDHHQKSQLRGDCEACIRNAFDKSVLLQAMDSHPSRFRRMNSDILSGMPSERQSHILFRCWLSGVHGPLPMVYPPKALEFYEQFWDWYKNKRESGEPMPNTGFLPFLYAIWYAGSVSMSLRGLKEWFPGTKRATLSAGFHDQITRCLVSANFPRIASIPSLAAFLTLTIIIAKEEEPLTSSLFVGLALRVAQMLGLHREPTLFNFEPWEVESRRRLWWHVVMSDTMISVSSGLPPLITDGFWDVKMVSEVKDTLIETPEGIEYEAAVRSGKRVRDNPDEPTARKRPSMVSVHNLVLRGRFIMALGVRRLLRIHLGTTPVTRKDMEEVRQILAEAEDDLNAIIKRIPTKGIPEMGFTPDRDAQGHSLVADFDPALAKPPSEEDLRPFLGLTPPEGLYDSTIQYHWNTLVAFHKWARILLSLWADKMYCVAYVPFLKNAKSKLWTTTRQCALRHSHRFMRKFISLATDPAFQPFQWSWPGNHQPMHAAMIMLIDLYERPGSAEAPRSRALIDKIFSLSGPDGGIVSGEDGVTVQRPLREGGRQAWDMLRRLRDKAWQKAGLDPNVLWTEDDQVRLGVAKPLSESEKIAQSLREDMIPLAEPKTTVKSSPYIVGAQQLLKASLQDSQWTQDASTAPAPSGPPPQNGSSQQEPAPFRFRIQKPSNTEIPKLGVWNLGAAPKPASGDGPSNGMSTPVPPIPSSVPYFNPPAFSPSITQASDSGANTTVSENFVPDANNAPTPNISVAANPHAPNRENSIAHFDWDQWDAVFGQHVPVDDPMMEMDWGEEQPGASGDADMNLYDNH